MWIEVSSANSSVIRATKVGDLTVAMVVGMATPAAGRLSVSRTQFNVLWKAVLTHKSSTRYRRR